MKNGGALAGASFGGSAGSPSQDPVWHLTEPKAWETIGTQGQPDCGVGCRILLNVQSTTLQYYSFSYDMDSVVTISTLGLVSSTPGSSVTTVFGPTPNVNATALTGACSGSGSDTGTTHSGGAADRGVGGSGGAVGGTGASGGSSGGPTGSTSGAGGGAGGTWAGGTGGTGTRGAGFGGAATGGTGAAANDPICLGAPNASTCTQCRMANHATWGPSYTAAMQACANDSDCTGYVDCYAACTALIKWRPRRRAWSSTSPRRAATKTRACERSTWTNSKQ